LFPAQFRAFIYYNGKTTELAPIIFPKNFHGHTEDSTKISYADSLETDLLKLRKLMPDEVCYGRLFTFVDETSKDQYDDSSDHAIELTCTDFFGRTYSSGFVNPGPAMRFDNNTVDPKSGLSIQTK